MTTPSTGPDVRRLGPGRFQEPGAPEPRNRWLAIGAILVLLALVVGVPVGMIMLEAVPGLPTSLPTREQLTARIGTEQLMSVLIWVVWIAWTQFAITVVVELRSALVGVGLPARVPLAGPSQRFARTLVASALLLGTAAGPATALTTDAVHTASTPAAVTVVEQGPASGPDVAAPAGLDATEVVTSQEERAQVALPQADVIYRLGGLTLSPEEGAELNGRRVYVVQPPEGRYHDNLWDIAERTLGDGRRYVEIFELNKGREQPDGRELSLARLIQPDWLLVMPEDANVDRVEAVAPPTHSEPSEHGPVQTAPAADEAIGVHGADVAGSAAGGGQDSADVERGVVDSLPGLVGAGLLAAGLLAAVEVLRRRRRTPEPSEDAVEAEIALRIGARPDRASRLEEALCSVAETHRAARRALPNVYAARVDDDVVELLLSPPAVQAPEPWTVLDEGRRWRRAVGAGRSAARSAGPAPYPGLVSLGQDAGGADVLVDLEAAQGPVAVTGPEDIARQVVTAIAAELATNTWSGPITVHGHALPDALAALGNRYRPVTDPAAVVRGWVDADTSGTDVLTGRALLAGASTSPGEYLLVGTAVDEPLRAELSRLRSTGRAPWGVIGVGDVPGARWQVRVDGDGRLTVDVLGLELAANRLRARDTDALAELVSPAAVAAPVEDLAGTEQPPRPDVPVPPIPVDLEDLRAAPVAVRVLGAPAVRAPGALAQERLTLTTELVVHLALHPEGVHRAVLAGDLWPHGVTAEVRDATIDRTRRWLGTDAHGAPRLRDQPDGRLTLSRDVVVDWHVLLTVLGRSRAADSRAQERADLTGALGLGSGAVLAERPSGRYAWLARVRLERVSRDLLVDAAHRLAVLCSDDGDPGGAEAAARAGIAVSPSSEILWRDLMRARSVNDGPDGVHEVAAELEATMHGLGDAGMSAPTAALVEELAPRGEVGGTVQWA